MSQPSWNPPQHSPFTAPASRCRNHPEREGIGICVQCRSVVCVECSTKIDRINYCIRCLEAAHATPQAAPADPVRQAVYGLPLLVAAFGGAVAIFFAFGYLLALWRQ